MAALEGCLVFYSLARGKLEQVLDIRESHMLAYTIAILESTDVNSNYTSVT